MVQDLVQALSLVTCVAPLCKFEKWPFLRLKTKIKINILLCNSNSVHLCLGQASRILVGCGPGCVYTCMYMSPNYRIHMLLSAHIVYVPSTHFQRGEHVRFKVKEKASENSRQAGEVILVGMLRSRLKQGVGIPMCVGEYMCACPSMCVTRCAHMGLCRWEFACIVLGLSR